MEEHIIKYKFERSKLDKISWRFTSNDIRTENDFEKASSFPRSAIGLLKVTYPHNTVSYRTGVLIGENVILTAGHNLYDSRQNPNSINEILGSPEKIEFYPGLTKNQSKYKCCTNIKKFYFPSEFKNKDKEDYGIIILNENIGKETGFFKLKIFDESLIENEFYNCGYPLNKTTDNNEVYYQFECKGKIIRIINKDSVIVTGIKSSYGQSGAGLWYYDENQKKYYVIGVHVASTRNDEFFYSTMINKKRYEQIQKWINENK